MLIISEKFLNLVHISAGTMPSLQFRIWSSLIEYKFSQKDLDSDIDLSKARFMDCPNPPRGIARRMIIERQVFSGRNLFLITGKKQGDSKVLLYLHGGAFISGITKMHWSFSRKLASSLRCRVIMPEYPLAPENSYRETTGFILELYRHLLNEYETGSIYVLGDSAGGNLALTLSLLLHKNKLPQPGKIILLSPWLDASMSNPQLAMLEQRDIMLSRKKLISAGKLYAGDTDTRNPLLSPIYGDLTNLPETHVFTSDHDLLYADSKRLLAMADESRLNIYSYEYKQMMHVWMLFPIPEAKKVRRQLKQILEDA